MPDLRPQRASSTLSRERPAPPAGVAFASSWSQHDPPRTAVTAYDEIWFLGRPQLP